MANRLEVAGPIAAGGIGGSGTRVVAELLSHLGVFIGATLNRSNDIMTFPRFSEITDWAFVDSPSNHRVAMSELAHFEHEMLESFRQCPDRKVAWGWKAPPTFLFLPYLAEFFPTIRYVHVIRHGLDMAYSKNANQLKLIGHRFGIDHARLPRAEALLKYWISANNFAIELARSELGERFLLLSFDALCAETRIEIARLAAFIGLRASDANLDALCRLVRPPSTIGRYKKHNYVDIMSESDAAELRRYGFSVGSTT